IYAVSPRQIDDYFLCTLLFHVPGAIFYNNLKIFVGIIYHSFKTSVITLELVTDDEELHDCLTREELFCSQFRSLSEITILYCSLSDSLALWIKFRNELSKDYIYRINSNPYLNDLNKGDANEIFFLDLVRN
ncbi:hypothetical protein K501DRAFT_173034, partial [Backusella circina FSU 941]